MIRRRDYVDDEIFLKEKESLPTRLEVGFNLFNNTVKQTMFSLMINQSFKLRSSQSFRSTTIGWKPGPPNEALW